MSSVSCSTEAASFWQLLATLLGRGEPHLTLAYKTCIADDVDDDDDNDAGADDDDDGDDNNDGGRLGCSGDPVGVDWGALGALWESTGVLWGAYGGRLGCYKPCSVVQLYTVGIL